MSPSPPPWIMDVQKPVDGRCGRCGTPSAQSAHACAECGLRLASGMWGDMARMSEVDRVWRVANGAAHDAWLQAHYPDYDQARASRGATPLDSREWERVIVTTSHELPSFVVQKHIREVMGITVRTRNVFSNAVAGLTGVVGGEVVTYTKLMTDARDEALERMRTEAHRLGANAVISMRLDTNQISDLMTEFVAYGAAVVVSHLIDTPQTAPGGAAS